VSGLIKDQESLDHMRKTCKIGDIIDVIVTDEFDLVMSQSLGERQIVLMSYNFNRNSP